MQKNTFPSSVSHDKSEMKRNTYRQFSFRALHFQYIISNLRIMEQLSNLQTNKKLNKANIIQSKCLPTLKGPRENVSRLI